MAKKRISIKVKLEKLLKKNIAAILKENFKGIVSFDDAAAKLKTITKGKITASEPTIKKLILESKMDIKDFPFAAPKERKHRPSSRELLEQESGLTIWELIEPLKDDSLDDAALVLEMSAATLLKIIHQGIEAEEISADDYANWLPGKRGKQSWQEIIETREGKSIAEILEPFKTMDKEEAAQTLGVGIQTLLKTIQRAEIKGFEHWFKPQRKKNIIDDIKTDVDLIKVTATCAECGATTGWLTKTAHSGLDLYDLGLKARRCVECKKWGLFVARAEFGGKQIIKKLVPIGSLLIEEFVDERGKIIKNPLEK